MGIVHQVVMESVTGCSHHPVEHLFGNVGALRVGDKEKARLGCGSVREAVADNFQLFAFLLNDDPADMSRGRFNLGW